MNAVSKILFRRSRYVRVEEKVWIVVSLILYAPINLLMVDRVKIYTVCATHVSAWGDEGGEAEKT